MRIMVDTYPATFTFNVRKELPRFKYGCRVRTEILHRQLRKVDYKVQHAVTDFVVESVDKVEGGEVWHLGS